MRAFMKKNKKIGSKETQNVKNSSLSNNNGGVKNQLNNNSNEDGVTNPLVPENNLDVKLDDSFNGGDTIIKSNQPPEFDLINKKLPKELILRIFSNLDIIDLCRCAQVSKYWNELALDGSNWQYVDLFDFQIDVNVLVVENLAKRCNEFLKGVRLENCRTLTDEAIVKLSSYCKNIEILNLIQCIKLTNEAFNQIGANLTKLVYLNLESCSISDIGLKSISKGCTNLQSLDISYCKSLSSDALINFVGSNSNLKYFSCRSLTNINDNVIKKLAENCSNLVYLNIKGCNNVSDEGLASFANNCQYLKHLNISNCNHLTDLTLQSLGAKCSELSMFECAGCFNFSDNGFLALTKGCHDLSRLDLEECTRITDTTLNNLSVNCPSLRHLTLSRCENITDEGIRQLGLSSCASVNETLQVLELDNCPLISDASLETLYGCQSLVQLELYDCQQITRNGIKKFQARLPNVKVHAYFAPSTNQTNQRPSRSCSCKCCIIL